MSDRIIKSISESNFYAPCDGPEQWFPGRFYNSEPRKAAARTGNAVERGISIVYNPPKMNYNKLHMEG